MELKEETLSSEVLYRGRVVTLKKDRVTAENGVEAAREVVCHPGGVSAAALTPDNPHLPGAPVPLPLQAGGAGDPGR